MTRRKTSKVFLLFVLRRFHRRLRRRTKGEWCHSQRGAKESLKSLHTLSLFPSLSFFLPLLCACKRQQTALGAPAPENQAMKPIQIKLRFWAWGVDFSQYRVDISGLRASILLYTKRNRRRIDGRRRRRSVWSEQEMFFLGKERGLINKRRSKRRRRELFKWKKKKRRRKRRMRRPLMPYLLSCFCPLTPSFLPSFPLNPTN